MECLRYGRRYGVDPRENLLTFDKRKEEEEERRKAAEETPDGRRLKRMSKAQEPPGFAVLSNAVDVPVSVPIVAVA